VKILAWYEKVKQNQIEVIASALKIQLRQEMGKKCERRRCETIRWTV
jgi:hypothetical protein